MKASARAALFWAAVGAAGCALHWINLGESALWQDEAEVAVIGRNVLRYGLPKVYDGLNVVTQNAGADHDANFVANLMPWLQLYAAAASFAALGESSFAARFPFATVGVANLFLLAALCRRWGLGRGESRLAALLCLLSVPHLLYARQCRYYMLAELFALLLYWAYEDLLEERRRAGPLMAAALLGLFHSSYFLFVMVVAMVGAHFAIFARRRLPLLRRQGAWPAIAGLLLVPGLVYFNVFQKAAGEAAKLKADRWMNLKAYAWELDGFILPLGAALLLAALRRRLPQRPLFLLAAGVLILGAFPRFFPRYTLMFVPLLCALYAAAAGRAHERRPALAWALVAVVAGSNLLSLSAWLGLRPKLKTELAAFLGELSRPYPEPIKAAAERLNVLARPGELLLVSYPDIPFMFYTKLRVVGGLQGRRPIRADEAVWVLLRDESERAYWPVDYSRYTRIPLAAPARPWGNRPDPSMHLFRPAGEGQAALYRLKGK